MDYRYIGLDGGGQKKGKKIATVYKERERGGGE